MEILGHTAGERVGSIALLIGLSIPVFFAVVTILDFVSLFS